MRLLTFLAKRFVAGDDMHEAARAVKKLNDQGFYATMDVLGENVSSRQQAEGARDSYLELLDLISREKLGSNVSLKLTQMGLDIDRDFCADNLRKIVSKARDLNNFVRVDMEGTDHTQRTLDVFKSVYNEFRGFVGIVIQAYLYRSKEDIDKLNSEGATIRLCKGAYKEPHNLAIKNMPAIRDNFMSLSQNILKSGKSPAFATHDRKLILSLKDYIKNRGIPKDTFEFQMLYGIRRKLAKNLVDEGFKVRIYVPFGTHWFPYTIRRLRERKENVFLVLGSLFCD